MTLTRRREESSIYNGHSRGFNYKRAYINATKYSDTIHLVMIYDCEGGSWWEHWCMMLYYLKGCLSLSLSLSVCVCVCACVCVVIKTTGITIKYFCGLSWKYTSRSGPSDGWWLMFYGHCCGHGKLNGPSEVKHETPFRYAKAEIRTQVVVICGPTRYQLDQGGIKWIYSE